MFGQEAIFPGICFHKLKSTQRRNNMRASRCGGSGSCAISTDKFLLGEDCRTGLGDFGSGRTPAGSATSLEMPERKTGPSGVSPDLVTASRINFDFTGEKKS